MKRYFIKNKNIMYLRHNVLLMKKI